MKPKFPSVIPKYLPSVPCENGSRVEYPAETDQTPVVTRLRSDVGSRGIPRARKIDNQRKRESGPQQTTSIASGTCLCVWATVNGHRLRMSVCSIFSGSFITLPNTKHHSIIFIIRSSLKPHGNLNKCALKDDQNILTGLFLNIVKINYWWDSWLVDTSGNNKTNLKIDIR